MSSIRAARSGDAGAVAALHGSRIAEGFLTTLGMSFLERLYRRMIRSAQAFVLVHDDQDGIDAFVAVADHTGRLYREFVMRDGPAVVITTAPAIVRNPKRIWETLRYGIASGGDLPASEILAVAVAQRAEGRGVGGELVRAALDELQARGVAAARVVTAVGNAPALRMYETAGFRRFHQTEVHAGISQQVLVWP